MEFNRETYNKGRRFFWQVLLSCHEAIVTNRPLRNPGDIPVQTPTKYETALNLKTAKALCLSVSSGLRGRRGDRITILIAALHESAFGTKQTFVLRCRMSAFGGRAEIRAKADMGGATGLSSARCRREADSSTIVLKATKIQSNIEQRIEIAF
jgi:hypothetical protein